MKPIDSTADLQPVNHDPVGAQLGASMILVARGSRLLAVVGAPGATMRIATGQRITVEAGGAWFAPSRSWRIAPAGRRCYIEPQQWFGKGGPGKASLSLRPPTKRIGACGPIGQPY